MQFESFEDSVNWLFGAPLNAPHDEIDALMESEAIEDRLDLEICESED